MLMTISPPSLGILILIPGSGSVRSLDLAGGGHGAHSLKNIRL
jgi:hypothetical protein